MQLTWQPDDSALAVTGIDGERVRIGRDWRESSVYVNARQLRNWAPQAFSDINEAALDELLLAQPEVILLGTGSIGRQLAPALMAHVLRRGCGIECMSNAAAARTYNVLLGESRAVLAAFLIAAA